MYGPWYPLEEACEILGIRRSELSYLIAKGELQPVAFTTERPFLLTSRDTEGRWIGRASCRYRGHLRMHPKVIQPLIDGEPIKVKSGMAVLEPEAIGNWSSSYPFKRQDPIPPLSGWQPAVKDPELIRTLIALPFPKEGVSTHSALSRATKHIEKALEAQKTGDRYEMRELFPVEDNQLFFEQNNEFSPKDVRIPASEIESYLDRSNVPEAEAPPRDTNQKENQLHTLLFRIIQHNPDIKAKQAWALLEEDYEADTPKFDIDGIVQAISPTELEWLSRHGNTSYQKFSSFAPTLSKVRRKYRENKEAN